MAKTKQRTSLERYDAALEVSPGTIVLIRNGDFYETFREGAEVAAKILGLTLTTMEKGESIPMVGFPAHSVDDYLMKLIKAGYRCSVME